MPIPDPVDLQGCEHCGKEFPLDECVTMVDCWYCDGCYKEWKAVFDACQHDWEPELSEFGEDGRYCHKCSGFQLLETEGAPSA